MRTLEVTQRKMERRMLRLTILNRWSAERMRALTKLNDWTNEATKKKLQYAGIIRGMDDNEWVKLTTTWIPYDHVERRRHPCTRWRDEISRKIGRNWWSMTDEQFDKAMIRHSNMN
ncbi:hypothetical protein Y032_0192g1370 [Ancylostoma ceylanicum]|uniref:Endonuclease-reverse transcriptase n=1 Tax=Ancylostoma ceylanicum TaxID=53326 RepID=A0A016SQM9_9BILA|nr:hypothetical protein Y032_0192g1370 [Ancylostoma ceylanicum]